MSRRKQARPRSCRESLEDGAESSTFLGESNKDTSSDLDTVAMAMDYRAAGDHVQENTEEDAKPGEVTVDADVGDDSGEFCCDSCDVMFYSLTQFMYHRNFVCTSAPHPDGMIGLMKQDQPMKLSLSASPASLYSGEVSQTPSPMDCEPLSPSMDALTPEEIPFHVGLGENHPYACQFCEKAFSRLGFLKKHEQVHQDLLPFKCEFCHRSFKHKRSRDRHVKLHTGDKKYRCTLCHAAFARSDHLKIHQRSHETGKPFQCPQCHCGYATLAALTSHFLCHRNSSDPNKPLECLSCKLTFGSVAELQNHLLTHKDSGEDDKISKCIYCGESFTEDVELEQHIEEFHGEEILNACPVCSECFSTGQQLIDHMALHNAATFSIVSPGRPLSSSSMASQNNEQERVSSPTKPHNAHQDEDKNVCPYCYREDFVTLELLEIHMQSVHSVKPTDIYTCNYCNAPYPNLYSLHEHMRVVHKNQPCLDIKYPCSFCSLEFSSIELLAEHRRSKHGKMLQASPQQHKQILESITCMQCTMVFNNPALLQEHLVLVHTRPIKQEHSHTESSLMKPHSSKPQHKPEISQSYKTDSSSDSVIVKHLRAALTSRSPSRNRMSLMDTTKTTTSGRTCDHCNATFADTDDYQCHMKIHLDSSSSSSDRRHHCSFCNKDFPSEDQLEGHMFAHFLRQMTEYGCTSCVKVFSKPDELQKHLMDIHAHHLYRCSLCKEIFDSKVNIQVHFAIKHSNECKLFKCTDCGSVFRSEMEWQLHVKVSHLQISKPFRCLFCHESFATEIELQCHLTTHKKSYHCTMCSESFHVEYLLDKHLEEVHANQERRLVTETVHIKVEKENIRVNVTSTAQASSLTSHLPGASPEPCTSTSSVWKTMETCVWYTCNICDTKFNQPAALQLHKLQQHQQKVSTPSRQQQHHHHHQHQPQISSKSLPILSTPSPVRSSPMGSRVSESPQSHAHVSEPVADGLDKMSHGCCFCSQTFRTKGEMDKHMKIHVNSGGQKCNICDEVFSSTNVLAEHKLQHCKVPQGNVCVGCKKPLKTEEQFYTHSQEHGVQGGMMQCIICRQSLASMIELQMHGKHHFQVKPSFYTCCVCLKTFDSRENLISKLNSSGRTYYVCKPCYHGEMSQYPCNQCGAKFTSRDQLDVHSLSHRKTYQCIKCQESFSSEYEIQVHVATHMMQEGNVHECKLCLCNFESPAKLQCHLIEHTYPGCELQCHVCGSIFLHAIDIQAHAVEHGISARVYACSQCNQRFFFSAELENHLLGHTQQSTSSLSLSSPNNSSSTDLECPDCNKTFLNAANLSSHRKIHDKRKEALFKCSLCAEEFMDVGEMQTHFFSSHADSQMFMTGKRVFRCTECEQEFPCLSNLQGHMRIHEPGVKHTCPVCKKVFALSRNLHIHLRSHSGEKPYECPICKKRFSRKENRKSHLKSHSNVKPFVCPICGKSFSRKSHVKDHMRVHFAQDPTNQSLLETIQEPDTGSTSDTMSPASDGAPWNSSLNGGGISGNDDLDTSLESLDNEETTPAGITDRHGADSSHDMDEDTDI